MAQESRPRLDEESDLPSWREVRHYLEAPRRRPLTALVPWVVVVLLSVVALFVLPKKYQSSTTILVESEKVPESFVPRVATEDTSRQLWSLRPEILSRTRLERVLDETDPYPEIASKTQAVAVMQKAVSVNVTGNEGFTLAFVHRDPYKAQQVANRIATLFIEETIRSREEQVSGAVDFLETQVADARKELEAKDAALRRFREERMGRLPEQLQANLATMSMLQREIQSVEENLYFDREKRDALLRSLQPGPGAGGAAPGDTSELADLRRQLAVLKARRYTDEHPDVESLRSRIARLEAQASEQAGGGAAPAVAPVSNSRAEVERLSLEIKSLEEKRDNLEGRIATVRRNVEQTPRTEQELASITRDYDQLRENYTTLLNKQLEAQMAGRLEQRWKGDRFRILDPANLPEKPVFPKPWLILGLGAVLGVFAGIGASMGAEFLDPTIKDVEDLRAAQDYPILATIPRHTDL